MLEALEAKCERRARLVAKTEELERQSDGGEVSQELVRTRAELAQVLHDIAATEAAGHY